MVSYVAEGEVVKVFVTGATGVLGKVAVRALLDDGHQVTALARGVDRARSLEADGAALMSVTRALTQTGHRSASGLARTGHTSCTPRTLHEMAGSKPAHPVFEPQPR